MAFAILTLHILAGRLRHKSCLRKVPNCHSLRFEIVLKDSGLAVSRRKSTHNMTKAQPNIHKTDFTDTFIIGNKNMKIDL